MLQETVTNTNDKKSLFSSYLEVLEAKEKQLEAESQLQEEKYLRRTRKIYDFHERQCREAVELRRCLDFVSQHALVLESVLQGAEESAGGVPLAASLARQAAPLQRSMAECVANAVRIRTQLAAAHRPQMDAILTKMESELGRWTSFLQRAAAATHSSQAVVDNLRNLLAEQRLCVRELSASSAFASVCDTPKDSAQAEEEADSLPPRSPPTRTRPARPCSTPIARD